MIQSVFQRLVDDYNDREEGEPVDISLRPTMVPKQSKKKRKKNLTKPLKSPRTSTKMNNRNGHKCCNGHRGLQNLIQPIMPQLTGSLVVLRGPDFDVTC
jgi:hypothetical protein